MNGSIVVQFVLLEWVPLRFPWDLCWLWRRRRRLYSFETHEEKMMLRRSILIKQLRGFKDQILGFSWNHRLNLELIFGISEESMRCVMRLKSFHFGLVNLKLIQGGQEIAFPRIFFGITRAARVLWESMR